MNIEPDDCYGNKNITRHINQRQPNQLRDNKSTFHMCPKMIKSLSYFIVIKIAT